MIEVFDTTLVMVALILVVYASIGVVIAVFAKNKGLKFENFFQKFKKGIFFSNLADFLTCTKRRHFKFYKLQISCPRLCKINFKEEAISVGHPVLEMAKIGYRIMIIRYRQLVERIGAQIMKTEDAIAKSQIVVMAVPKGQFFSEDRCSRKFTQ